MRHLNSHIHALHNLSTAAQRLAEALIAELPAEDTDPSGNEAYICPERPAAPVTIEESMVIADTTVPTEDVTVTRQVDVRNNNGHRNEGLHEGHPVQAPDVTTPDSPSSSAGVVTQGPSSQDIPSENDEDGKHSGEPCFSR